MKKSILFIFLAACTFCMSCSDKTDTNGGTTGGKLELGKTSLVFDANQKLETITVKSSSDNWTATVPDAAKEWCSVTLVKSRDKSKLTITVKQNTDLKVRSTEVTVAEGGETIKVAIQQLGEEEAIIVDQPKFIIESGKVTISIEVRSNIEYGVTTTQAWIAPAATKLMTTETLKFNVAENIADKRTAEIILKKKNGDITTKVAIEQSKREGYTSGDPNDIQKDIKVPVSTASTSSYQGGYGIEKSIDGDMNTRYESNWNNNVANYFPITLEYFFSNVEKIDYLVYYPRADGGYNGHFKEIEVWIKTKAEPTYKKYSNYDFQGVNTPSRVVFFPALIEPTAVKIVVNSGSGDRIGFATCSEMEFYKKNTANSIDNIFTDETCSELIPGVTYESIDKLENSIYRNIALSLFLGDYPKEFRVQTYAPRMNPDVQAKENKTAPYSLLDNPTGISVTNGEELIVFAGNTNGVSVALQSIDFSKGYGGATYPLAQGINRLTMKNTGLLYVMYNTTNAAAQPVKIHVATGKVNGYYDITKHAKEDWTKRLNAAQAGYFDVLGKYAHITFPVSSFKQYCNDGFRLMQIYDSIAYLEQEFMGLYKYNKAFKNRMYFHVIYGDGYMYATSYRTAYHEGTLKELCNPSLLRTSAIWGPAHEVGHVNQTRPGFKWVGMSEVSNNVHSLAVQTAFGNATRIQSESLSGEGWTNRYEKAFTSLIGAKIAHATHSDVFCKLIPFWQLQLYYANVKGYVDFYKDLYEQVRIQPDPATNGQAQLNFIKICSDLVQEDLTDFFKAWGMLTTINLTVEDYSSENITITQDQIDEIINYMSKYPKPAHKIEYIYDDCVNMYKNNSTIITGTVTKTGNTYEFKNWKNVIVYEVYNNGILWAVTPLSKVGVPGAANNLEIYAIAANGNKIKVQL